MRLRSSVTASRRSASFPNPSTSKLLVFPCQVWKRFKHSNESSNPNRFRTRPLMALLNAKRTGKCWALARERAFYQYNPLLWVLAVVTCTDLSLKYPGQVAMDSEVHTKRPFTSAEFDEMRCGLSSISSFRIYSAIGSRAPTVSLGVQLHCRSVASLVCAEPLSAAAHIHKHMMQLSHYHFWSVGNAHLADVIGYIGSPLTRARNSTSSSRCHTNLAFLILYSDLLCHLVSLQRCSATSLRY